MVYGLGSNYEGSLGLGHDSYVREIQEIEGLRHKNITQFFNGADFVLALTQHNCLYGWGLNYWGQLGLELPNMDFPFIKPELINPENMENKSIYQISCGFQHTMILTSDRCVYGWGDNMHGQLGCGPDYEGQVFSWGKNDFYQLGHKSSDNIWKPQLIADMTVVSEVSEYKRLYVEKHSLGSGAFGEVKTIFRNLGQNIVSNICVNVCRIFFNTNHKYLVDNWKNP
ncbi:unnamed protein product [Oppiella nova]|uniref:Uncharacterized protein n=1 Tax=Oppiella nova TaxID=334625 RepID=A0A7R9MEG8_9ACAR|nr:unnamed protein product [Oppiella nova]CAG2175893.1 unnamed protein product [Oppiella nova]